MKRSMSVFAVVAVLGLYLVSPINANANDEHHKDATAQEQALKKDDSAAGAPMGHMMDGKMDMKEMKGMMHNCMATHKDGEMCDSNMMTKCQEHMGKNDCQKMMKKMKTEKNK